MKKYMELGILSSLICTIKNFIPFLSLLFLNISLFSYNDHSPRLAVNIVVDQLSYNYIIKMHPYLKHGLKFLLDRGIVYTNAYMPHGQPGTATGHAALNTGTYAKDHGFVSNTWYENGKKIACDDDDSSQAQVLSDENDNPYGKSAHRLMVDGLSDQCVLDSKPNSIFTAYSISLKSRAAIATAGRLGKALWLDEHTGMFTSSKAYFEILPEWIQHFNKHNNMNSFSSCEWKPMYPHSPYAYQFFDLDNYTYTRPKKTLLNQYLHPSDSDHPYALLEKTPYANQLLLDCANECIKKHVSKKHKDRLLLWVCLGPLDRIAHQYGPNSIEAIDMIYHLDKQLKKFIRKTFRIIGKNELIITLTADHAVMPIPELLQKKGFNLAQRIDRVSFVDSINAMLKEKYSLEDFVKSYKGQELIFDTNTRNTSADLFSPATTLADLSSPERTSDNLRLAQLTNDIKQHVLAYPGIKNVWTFDELMYLPTQPHTLEDNIKKQLFKGRSGSLIVQPYPYTVITRWPQGAAHKTPYNYDTHVPLVIYYPHKFVKKYVRQRVSPLQLPNTLAEILNVPKPSASTCDILPELFDPEYK